MAVAQNPGDPEAHNTLGSALTIQGQLDDAIAAFRQAIALKPNYSEAFNNLGSALALSGKLDEAIAAYRDAIALNPDLGEAHGNLGSALTDKGQFSEAVVAYRRAVVLKPHEAELHYYLGNALKETGQFADAVAAYREAIALVPDDAEIFNDLGIALKHELQFRDAIAAYRRAISLNPQYAEARCNLAAALKATGDFDEAIPAYRQALAVNPDLYEAHIDLGDTLKDTGQLDEAIAAYRQAIAANPGDPKAYSDVIFAMHYHPGYDARSIADELRDWNSRHAEPLRQFIQPHSSDRDPDRVLRIGYVSPDFRNHPVGRNLLPLFQHHDRRHFEITAYASVRQPDAMTGQLRQNADRWRDIVALNDEEAARQIRDDQIDILIDLALHTGGNRSLVFARKPAPVQVSYLGYCGSTGLDAIDYRISDHFIDPPELGESYYSEKTIRLRKSYWCYQPDEDLALDVSPPPAVKNGFVTFGCQNNYCKISPPLWNAWMAILRAAPTSRFLVFSPPGSHRDAARKRLAGAGINPERLQFSQSTGREYFHRYGQIDIALDPFPFCGGHTTCDALWMGVPVVTLSGETAVGRGGRSILSNIGLPELIALAQDEYVRKAIDLANDPSRMETLRRTMRERMRASPLMDAEQFARDMESVYRRIWRVWSQGTLASD
jgi:predicted O-linked N-acetylglucosamine transferase (SPINDLY family)